MLTGSTFSADEAALSGLVTEVADDVEAAVDALCAIFASCSPRGLRESKQLLTYDILAGFDRSSDRVIEHPVRLFHGAQAREGMVSFLDKRQPWWAE